MPYTPALNWCPARKRVAGEIGGPSEMGFGTPERLGNYALLEADPVELVRVCRRTAPSKHSSARPTVQVKAP